VVIAGEFRVPKASLLKFDLDPPSHPTPPPILRPFGPLTFFFTFGLVSRYSVSPQKNGLIRRTIPHVFSVPNKKIQAVILGH
jgi:hypothetical protein